MKKIYFLFLLFSMGAFAQNVTITKIIETDCPSPYVKTVELYVDGTVDFSKDVVLNYMSNGKPWADNQIDISAFGVQSNKFLYIVRDIDLMRAEFPSTTFDASNTVVVNTATNGDDGYQVVLNGKVVSQFGRTETDADNDTIWEHDDSVVSRKSGVPDKGTWNENDWDYSGKNTLDGHTKCKGGNGVEAYLNTLGGTYPLGSGSGWTPSCDTDLTETTATCNSKTIGATNDTYTATIAFVNGNNGNTFTITSTAGTVSGDSPTSKASGTITISNIPEGTDITVTVSDTAGGGSCALTKDIKSPGCIPLVLNEALFDPASDDPNTNEVEGDANGDGVRSSSEDEFIELINNSNVAMDISGYTVYDASKLRHTFPASTEIPANGVLVLFGGGTPTGTFGGAIVQTASEGQLNLSNSGDVITIKNAAGRDVLVFDSTSTNVSTGSDQSITRSPEITGNFVLHSDAKAGVFFSPGTAADGTTLSTSEVFLKESFKLYPNPVSRNFKYINIQTNETDYNVEVYNVLGKKIHTILENNQLRINHLSTGVYLIKISKSNASITKKLLIE